MVDPQSPVLQSEDLVRGIFSEKVDLHEGRIFPSAFIDKDGLSVSRLRIAPLPVSWDVIRRTSKRPPPRKLEFLAKINVGVLQTTGAGYNFPVSLTVQPIPLDGFPSHAVVPEKISKGLANKIKKKCDYLNESGKLVSLR